MSQILRPDDIAKKYGKMFCRATLWWMRITLGRDHRMLRRAEGMPTAGERAAP